MNFENLHILHIYQYTKPNGKRCPRATFSQNVGPLELSTCMRHISIFTSQQLQGHEDLLNSLKTQLENPGNHQQPAKYEHLQGSQAYTLLLYWVTGGLNPKKPFNDIRILGDLRETLRKVEISASSSMKATWEANKAVARCLLNDAKHMLEWVVHLPENLALEEKEDLVRGACLRCAWAREQGLLTLLNTFDYTQFSNDERTMVHIHDQIELHEQKTLSEQKKITKRLDFNNFIHSQSIIHINAKLEELTQVKEKLQSGLFSCQVSF